MDDELAVRVHATRRALVLVAVTAMGNEASRSRIAAAGFDLHLVKPVDPRHLSDHIRDLWRAKAPESG